MQNVDLEELLNQQGLGQGPGRTSVIYLSGRSHIVMATPPVLRNPLQLSSS